MTACTWCGFRSGHSYTCVHATKAEVIATVLPIDWHARALAAEARLAEAREVLRSVESGSCGDCPACGQEVRYYGHAPDCRLRAVLEAEA